MTMGWAMRWTMLVTVALAFPAITVSQTAVADTGNRTGWAWSPKTTLPASIDIGLVRAKVTILRSSASVRVEIAPANSELNASVDISLVETSGVVVIRDIYPARAHLPNECLPPTDGRGDYWAYHVPLLAKIAVPAGTRLRVRLLDGDIDVNGVDGQFDLATNRGVVIRNRR